MADALEAYNKAVELDSRCAAARSGRANVWDKLGEYEKASDDRAEASHLEEKQKEEKKKEEEKKEKS